MVRAGTFRRHIENRRRPRNTAVPSLDGMDHAAPARLGAPRPSVLALGVLALLLTATTGVIAHQAASSSATSNGEVPRGGHHGPISAADGVVPDGTTVFDDQVPAVARLDPTRLKARQFKLFYIAANARAHFKHIILRPHKGPHPRE